MTGRYISSKQVGRPLLLLILFASLLTIPGCGVPTYARSRVDGETVIFTHHWSTPAFPLVFGFAFSSMGLCAYYDHLRQLKEPDYPRRGRNRQSKPPRRFVDLVPLFLHAPAFVIAGMFIMGYAVLMTHHYVAVNNQRYSSHWETAGGSSLDVDLSNLVELQLTKGCRGGKTDVLFIHWDDTRQSQPVGSGAERAALEYLIEKAPEWGYRVDDRRTDR